MIERPNYLEELICFKEKDLIKVVNGIRGCGKSTLFDLYIEYLLSNGVDKNQIIRINLEDYEFITYNKTYVEKFNFVLDYSGKRLKAAREFLGLTQEQVASTLNMTRNMIVNI